RLNNLCRCSKPFRDRKRRHDNRLAWHISDPPLFWLKSGSQRKVPQGDQILYEVVSQRFFVLFQQVPCSRRHRVNIEDANAFISLIRPGQFTQDWDAQDCSDVGGPFPLPRKEAVRRASLTVLEIDGL